MHISDDHSFVHKGQIKRGIKWLQATLHH